MLDVANEIWGQACIKLAPYYHGELIKEFHDIELLGAFGDCLNAEWKQKLKPYDITTPDKLIINLYLVDDANFACGSPISGHVILPTAGKGSEWLGKVLAHEIGHVLLNPLGIDNSDDPDHVMYHPENHPGVPLGSRDGLFMSDCLGVRKRVAEDFGGFADVPGGTSPAPLSCIMLPRLGNNLVVIEAMQQK